MLYSKKCAIYKGKEYDLNIEVNGQRYIYTVDTDLTDDTFMEVKPRGYKKYVVRSELEDAYFRQYFAVFENGIELLIVSEARDRYLVSTMNSRNKELIKKYQFEVADKGVYEGWVNKNKVEIVEKKSEINW